MKTILFALCTILCACHTTIGSKLQDAIEDYERGDDKFEQFKIDSLRYSLGTLKDYYLQIIKDQNENLQSYKYLLSSSRKTNDFPLIVRLTRTIQFQENRNFYLTMNLNKFSVKPELYECDYHLEYQSDKYNFSGHRKTFVYKDNLKPVYINIDSLYRHSSEFKAPEHDSADDVHFMMMNDSLLSREQALRDRLQLLIAGGVSYGRILEMEGQIDKVRVQYTGNTVKRIYLYTY